MNGPIIRYACASDGVNIAYGQFPGQGTPILAVPTLGQLSIAAYAKVPPLLEYWHEVRNGAPLTMFDARGTGLSGSFQGDPSVDQYAKDVAAVADAVGEPFHLQSLGSGCHAAARFAAEQPSRVLSFTILNPSPHELVDGRYMVGIMGQDYDMGVHILLRFAFELGPDVPVENVVAEFKRGFSKETFERLAEPRVNKAVCLADDLRRLQAPVLVIGAQVDMDWDNARVTAAMLPGAILWKTRIVPFNAAMGRAIRERLADFYASAIREPGRPTSAGLSSRQRDVLRLLAAGKTNAQIADVLTLRTATVATHVRNILEKTGSANRAEATAYAVRNGLA